jgi:Pin2-interacting protein X1
VQTDPNNNNWARNTDTFGQKILRAHGWAPGDFLGAKDAAHAVYHTEASSSHIKVSLKEDNLGLGAKRNNGDQCTGLDAFQDLLGRLNGKTDAVIEVEREARMAVKRNLYVERKFGVMKFVQGGWLVGDQETKALEALSAAKIDKEDGLSGTSDLDSEVSEPTTQKSKKRKAEDTDESKDAERKKSKKRRSEDVFGGETGKDRQKREKKEKKAKKRGLKGDRNAEDGDKPVKEKKKHKESKSGEDETNGYDDSTDPAAKKSKKEKRKKKEDGGSKSADDTDPEQKRSKKKRRKEKDISATASAEATTSEETAIVASATSTPTPVGSGTSTPSHHTSRRRFIAQKRAAFSDPKALAQVCLPCSSMSSFTVALQL